MALVSSSAVASISLKSSKTFCSLRHIEGNILDSMFNVSPQNDLKYILYNNIISLHFFKYQSPLEVSHITIGQKGDNFYQNAVSGLIPIVLKTF